MSVETSFQYLLLKIFIDPNNMDDCMPDALDYFVVS